MSKASVIRGYFADAFDALDTALSEFEYAREDVDEMAMSQALDYLEQAESAIADARERIEAFVLRTEPEAVDVRMSDLEGRGNLAGR